MKSNKKLIVVAIALVVLIGGAFLFINRGGKSTIRNITSGIPPFPVTSKEDISKLKSLVQKDLSYAIVNGNIKENEGKVVEWSGRVFVTPEKDKDGVYLQVFEADNSDNNFIVGYADPNFDVKEDDYIVVTGTVDGEFEGTNSFGAKLTAPKIKAGYIAKGTRAEVVAPTQKVIPVNQTNTQNDFSVTLDRIELAKGETRVYLKLKNASETKINFYTYDTKIVIGSIQIEAKTSSDDLPSEILAGVEATGSIIFPEIDSNFEELTLFLDKPSDYDYAKNWSEITFKVKNGL